MNIDKDKKAALIAEGYSEREGDGLLISPLMVMGSAAGHYVGRMSCNILHNGTMMYSPYERITDYMSETAASVRLKSIMLNDIVNNSIMQSDNGLDVIHQGIMDLIGELELVAQYLEDDQPDEAYDQLGSQSGTVQTLLNKLRDLL